MSSGTGSLEGKEIKREGALFQNGRTQGSPKYGHDSGGPKEEGTRKKPFIEVSVFQSVVKEGKK